MGLLLDTRTGRLITLSARAAVGRSPACAIALVDPRASAEHAVIAWSGERWEIRDLGSLNGTWLAGRRLAAGERAALGRNAELGFGSASAPWILANDRAPGPAARNESSSELVHATSGLLALPSADAPVATIFRRADGQWLVELGSDLRALADRQQLDIDGVSWQLFLPADLGPLPATLRAEGPPPVLADATAWFAPSLDEEHVEVRVGIDGGTDAVLPPRSSHYMLLTLARARSTDAQAGIASDEQGWLYASELADMLQYTPDRLNIEIFRARAVFAKLGFADSAQLIERRIASRQLRIGIARVHVVRPGSPAKSGTR